MSKENGLIEFSDESDRCDDIFEEVEEIYALESPQNESVYGPNERNATKTNTQSMLPIVWVNRVGSAKGAHYLMPVFTCLVSRVVGYKKLQLEILRAMSSCLLECHNVDELSHQLKLKMFVCTAEGNQCLPTDVSHPLFATNVEQELSNLETRNMRNSAHLKLIVEWDHDTRQSVLIDDDRINSLYGKKAVNVHESVHMANEYLRKNNVTRLEDCLDKYFGEEKVFIQLELRFL